MKKMLFKALGLSLLTAGVIGGAHAAMDGGLTTILSWRSSGSQSVDEPSLSGLSRQLLSGNQENEFKVYDQENLGGEMLMNAPAHAAGEAPAVIVGYAEMFDDDHKHEANMISFQSDGGNATYLGPLAGEADLYWIQGSVYADSLYYVYQNFPPKCGYLYDPKDFTEISRNTTFAKTDVPYGMAFNPVTKVVYGVFDGSKSGTYELATFDLLTQKRISTIGTVKQKFTDLVFDGDGNLYGFIAVSNNFTMYKVNTADAATVEVGKTGIWSTPFTNALYDYRNNHLYFIAYVSSQEKSYLYEIDPATAATTVVREVPDGIAMRGAFIKPSEVADDAPNLVKNLSAEFVDASLSGNVVFNLPDSTYIGNPGEGAIGYSVTINGKNYAEVAPAATLEWGQKIEVPVTLPELGNYKFEVAAVTSGGKGATETIVKWIGNDYPVKPGNVNLVYEKPVFTLTWDPVTKSANGGYLNPEKVTYKVFDEENNALSGELTECRWTTTDNDPQGGKKFNVVAYHEGLSSNAANSNTVGIITPAYRERFETGSSHSDWTVINADGDTYRWMFDESRERGGAYLRYTKDTAHDDYLVSPPLALEAGKSYNLFLKLCTDRYDEEVSVMMGAAPTAEALTTVVMPKTNICTSGVDRYFGCPVSVSETGVYYIALRSTTQRPRSGNLYIFEFDLSEPLSTEAPDYPSLKLTDDPNRLLKAELVIQAPSKNIAGNSLSNISRFDIYRETEDAKELVKSLENVTPGSEVKYVDEVPYCGEYTYSVVAYNNAGKGREIRDVTYVGVGIPQAISNFVVKERQNTAVIDLEWTAPKFDMMNRSLPADSVYYDIILNGNKRISYGYSDTKGSLEIAGLSHQQFIYFYIDAYTSAGSNRNNRVYSNMIPIGDPYTLPFKESTPSGNVEHNWSLSGVNNKWEMYNAVAAPSCYPQDADGGLWGWIPSYEGDHADLISGKMEISGENPVASFFYRAVSTSETQIQLMWHAMDETQWTVLKTVTLNETGKDDWVRVFVPLTAINNQTGQMAWRAIAGDTDNIVCIDNIFIGEIVSTDGAITSVYVPKHVKQGQPLVARAIVENIGVENIDGAVLKLQRNSEVVAQTEPFALVVGARTEIELKDETIDIFAGPELEYDFVLETENDVNPNDNVTEIMYSTVILPKTPVATGLKAAEGAAGIALSWTAPDLSDGNPDNIVTETFEDYKAWDIDRAGEWSFIDADKRLTVGIGGITAPDFYKPAAYRVFNNSEMSGSTAESYVAHSGHQYLAAFCSQEDKPEKTIVNDNWLVSPKLNGVAQEVSFWARTYNDYYGEEQFEFLTSTTDSEQASFKVLAKVTDVPMNQTTFAWQEYKFTVPEGTRYFAIRHISPDGFIFLLDDITYNEGGGNIKLAGYNVYRDGVKLNETPVANAEFIDTSVPDGDHTYHVTALYDLGESALSEPATIKVSDVDSALADGVKVSAEGLTVTVTGAEGLNIQVSAANGAILAQGIAGDVFKTTVANPGVYFVVVADKAFKLSVK
ncbi:MAG: hypothetical protein HDT07_00285 [Bacteroidales bacterium]|nr:hypothetical protein [Bacteroidales bacterium]